MAVTLLWGIKACYTILLLKLYEQFYFFKPRYTACTHIISTLIVIFQSIIAFIWLLKLMNASRISLVLSIPIFLYSDDIIFMTKNCCHYSIKIWNCYRNPFVYKIGSRIGNVSYSTDVTNMLKYVILFKTKNANVEDFLYRMSRRHSCEFSYISC